MGRAAFEHESSFLDQAMPAGAVLCRTEAGYLHMGILHRGRDGSAEILHLAWEDQLSRDWHWLRMWACPEVEPERLRAIAGLCRQIWRRYRENKRFAYALSYGGTHFDVSGGRTILGPGSRGLTCATFVLAVFRTFAIELIDESDWPVRTTQDFKFVMGLERIARSEHFQSLLEEVGEGCKRILPDEVLACASVELPAKFAPTRATADEILTRLG